MGDTNDSFWRMGKVRMTPLLDEPRHIVIKSRIHDEDVVGVIMEEGEPIKFITKVTAKPKIDWLAINREVSDGSY